MKSVIVLPVVAVVPWVGIYPAPEGPSTRTWPSRQPPLLLVDEAHGDEPEDEEPRRDEDRGPHPERVRGHPEDKGADDPAQLPREPPETEELAASRDRREGAHEGPAAALGVSHR